jgi:Leucine-rich repeat (LRR) protein
MRSFLVLLLVLPAVAKAAGKVEFCGQSYRPTVSFVRCSATRIDLAPLQGFSKIARLVLNGKAGPAGEPAEVVQLEALRPLPLKELQISDASAADLAPLRSVGPLRILGLSRVKVGNPGSLGKLTQVRRLVLVSWDDLRPVASLTGLMELFIDGSKAQSLEVLRLLTDLRELSLTSVDAKDLSPLGDLLLLEELTLKALPASDLAPLQSLHGLESLTAERTQVTDLEPLQGLRSLEDLGLAHSPVKDLSPLRGPAHHLQEVSLGEAG